MKKRNLLVILAVIISLLLFGCKHYDQSDADQITETGTQMMQTWLDENIPEAKLINCKAFVTNIRYTSREYLFDYAEGRVMIDGEECAFAIDTVTGDVYFGIDQGTQDKLNEIASNYLYETMGIEPEEKFFSCYVLAPLRENSSKAKAYQFHYGFDFGLPADVEDLEDFVRNPADRHKLFVQANITLPDETDLSAYNFETFEKLSEECGMLFASVSIENSTQTAERGIREWVTETSLREYGRWVEQDGIYLTGCVRVREEDRDDITGEMTAADRHFDPKKDLIWEKTDTGYRYCLPNKDWKEGFYIFAHENADMLDYNYTEYFYGDVDAYMAGKNESKKPEGRELIWTELASGDYVLSSKKNSATEYFTRAGELERTE